MLLSQELEQKVTAECYALLSASALHSELSLTPRVNLYLRHDCIMTLPESISCFCRTGKEVGLDITGCFYRSSSEHGPDGGVPSGAYIFRPDGACQTPGQKNISWTDNSIVFQSEEVRGPRIGA